MLKFSGESFKSHVRELNQGAHSLVFSLLSEGLGCMCVIEGEVVEAKKKEETKKRNTTTHTHKHTWRKILERKTR
jgi:hypothetical protein